MKASVSIQTGQKDPMKQKVRDVEEPLSISELVRTYDNHHPNMNTKEKMKKECSNEKKKV